MSKPKDLQTTTLDHESGNTGGFVWFSYLILVLGVVMALPALFSTGRQKTAWHWGEPDTVTNTRSSTIVL